MEVKIYRDITFSELLAIREKEHDAYLSNRQSRDLCKSGRNARKDSTSLSKKTL